ncbi:hypothetical protein MHYP_G00262130 [Metynnis hypsauchen]
MEAERKSERTDERKRKAIDKNSAAASEDPQPLNLALSPQSSQLSNPPAAGPVLENPGLGKKFTASTQGM